MKVTRKQSFVSAVVLGLLLLVAMPGTAFGDKGRRGHNQDRHNRWRKCAKFVNCHDASAGRRDGRGPRRVRRVSRNRNDWSWRNRNRNFNNDVNRRRVVVRRTNLR